jgi:hypothetical protein
MQAPFEVHAAVVSNVAISFATQSLNKQQLHAFCNSNVQLG